MWADQYPYPTSGTDGSTVLIPAWATRPPGANANQPPTQSRATMLKRVLGDPPPPRSWCASDIAHEIRRRGGADNIVVYDYTDKIALRQVARGDRATVEARSGRGRDPIQMEGLLDRNGGARMRGFSMAECDMEHIAKQPWVATSTDAGIALPADGPSTHARFYGSFTRKIRHYAIERGAITLEHAIRSSTSLPARIMRLTDRGQIREGMAADLVVFDLDDDPRQGDLLRAASALGRHRLRLRERRRPRDGREDRGRAARAGVDAPSSRLTAVDGQPAVSAGPS